MSEPTTETGRALAETLSEVPHYEYAPRLDTFAEDIAAIEAEARDQERARIAAAVSWVRPMQGDYLIEAMDGTTRTPQTPADWVEAYRAAVLTAITGEPTP